MAWILIDRPKTMKATKAIAQEFATMDEVPGERPLSEPRINAYRRMFKEGLFRPVTWAKCYCEETGATYRINGKHTSTLLSSLPEIPEFYLTVESYTAATLEDVSRLYAGYDSRLQSRTNFDINRAFAANIPEYKDIPIRFINKLVSGIGYAKWQEAYWAKSAAERAEVILEEVDFAIWAHSIIGSPHTRKSEHMDRAPVLAAMFLTWQKSHRDATAFWMAVRDETGEKPSLPDRTLAKYLSTTGVDTGLGANKADSKKADRRTFLVKCLHAWNAWRKGQATDLKYHATSKVPSIV